MGVLEKIFRIDARAFNKIKKKSQKVFTYAQQMENLSDEELKAKTAYFRDLLAKGKTLDDIQAEAFAVCREAARRVIGQYPFEVQVFGATVLNEGDVAELRTGEGKTLTATMAVYHNALAGKGVHVVTVNEYLASRDAEWMGQIYRFLGLTVGVNLREKETPAKQEAYQCDITYTTNSEIGFDYLRDNMAKSPGERVLRGLNYAVIDEADSILIDESRTPLIISGGSGITANSYITADRCVKMLKNDSDFAIDIKKKSTTLTDSGVDKVQNAFGIKNLYLPEYSDLVHRIHQALKANYTMRRDTEYMVRNDEIILIDTFTGRTMEGREYSDGLQQAIQAKEHVKIKPETVTLATITYQNFFRLYDKLAGMTGTAKTEEEEFRKIYNMRVVCIPTNKPIVRVDDIDAIYGNQKAKYKALVEEIKRRNELGQPILVGTASVEKSEVVHEMLDQIGLTHEVLNAKNHAREAAIIANAGLKGSITIATNMAGRGTDIKIDDEVKAIGGLAVLGTERHESRRIDNQLRGRSGRQGDPGYSRFFVSIDDELLQRFGSDSLKRISNGLQDEMLESSMFSRFITSAQKKVEGMNFDTRKSLLDYDDVLRKQREIMYKQRDFILYSPSISDSIPQYFEKCAGNIVKDAVKTVDQEIVVDGEKIVSQVAESFRAIKPIKPDLFEGVQVDEAAELLSEVLSNIYNLKKSSWPKDAVNYVEKVTVLQMVDRNWTKHIDTMSKLREAIYLRSYANTNPLQAYTNEGYGKYEEMMSTIAKDVVTMLLQVQVQIKKPEDDQDAIAQRRAEAARTAPYGGANVGSVPDAATTVEEGVTVEKEAIVAPKIEEEKKSTTAKVKTPAKPKAAAAKKAPVASKEKVKEPDSK